MVPPVHKLWSLWGLGPPMSRAVNVAAICAVACGGPESADTLPSWQADSIPLLDVAGTAANGDVVFEYASGATRLADGRVAIGDRVARVVRFVDASGRLVRTVGREGEGPGEFRDVTWLGQCGPDSVFVWDRMLDRMTVLDSAGRAAGQYRIPADPTAATPPAFVSCSRSGVFAFLSTPSGPMQMNRETGESPHYEAPLWLGDARGDLIHAFGDVAAAELRPLGKVTRLAVSDDRLYVGTNDSAFVDVYALDGRHLATLRVGVPARAPTRRHYERVIDELVAPLVIADERAQMKRVMLEVPMPARLPFYAELFVDPEGTLWVQTSIPGDPDTRLRAIGAEGAILGEVRVPADLRVFEVGLDYILGGYEEETGEPHMAVYRVLPKR